MMFSSAQEPGDDSHNSGDVEGLLESTLIPVEPPADLESRLEGALQGVTDAATEELFDWELAAMRDPRNWVRPAVAVAAGSMAGAALFLLRQQRRRRQTSQGTAQARRLLQEAADLASETRSRFRS